MVISCVAVENIFILPASIKSMKYGKLVAVAAVAAILSVSAYYYITYFSPPLSREWSHELGNTTLSTNLGSVTGDGNYYFLGMYSYNPNGNVSLEISAFNLTNGNGEWSLNITDSPGAFNFAGEQYGTVNAFPKIDFTHGQLYFLAYYKNLKAGGLNLSCISFSGALLQINPENGSINRAMALNFSMDSGTSLLTPSIAGNSVYLAYENYSAYAYETGISEFSLSNGSLLWNGSYTGPATLSVGLPSAFYTVSGNHVELFVQYTGHLMLYAIDRENGTSRVVGNMHNMSSIGGPLGDNIAYITRSGGKTYLDVMNMTTNLTSYTRTPFAGSIPEINIIDGKILLSCNSTVVAYSPAGNLLWNDTLRNAAVSNYLSGFTGLGNGHILFWSEVGGFGSNGYGISYNVVYNSFARLNATTGHITWKRSYEPLGSLFNKQGIPYQPLTSSGNAIIYGWYTGNQFHVAAASV